MSQTEGKLKKQSVKLGFIGLGLMGTRLTQRLLADGWNLRTWNRTPRPEREGSFPAAPVAASRAALVADSDVILSCLANDDAVRAVYLGDEGVLSVARPGTIIIEMSTISTELSLLLHRVARTRDLRLLDVAISGSTPAVEAGTLTLFAGGLCSVFEHCIPIFESIAKQWFFIGPESSGVRMKLVVNLLLGVGLQALAEAVALGAHLEIDPDVLLDVLSRTAVIPPALLGKFSKIRTSDYAPQFPLRLMSKDMNLVMEAAGSLAPGLGAARNAQKVFADNVDIDGDLDVSAIVPLVAGRQTRR
jgi:3-hydroxyisobutyrate dehydrogenase-like beta-hydroxyacid dehydrogenase